MYQLESIEHYQARIRNQVSKAKCFTWLGENLERLKEKTFETYDCQQFLEAYRVVRVFCETWDEQGNLCPPQMNLVFHGTVGTGKTHLMVATINFLRAHRVTCRFMTGQGLFDAIGERISQRQGYQDIIDEATKCTVLGIDDIDKTYVSSKVYEVEDSFQITTLFTIINRRYINGLSTLITTNAPDVSPFVGKAAFSRLKEHGRFISMKGNDYRDTMIICDNEE